MKSLFICVIFFNIGFINITLAQNIDKFYFQTNKPAYVAGETIWFKVYILTDLYPNNNSTSLIVDLLDESGGTIESKTLPIFGGTATGNFDLSLASEQGIFRLRAYTKATYKRQSGNEYISHHKAIYVFNPSSSKGLSNIRIDKEFTCKFYTSSEKLITGLANTVFFKATDQFNTPVSIRGSIVNSKDEKLIDITETYKGTGKFEISPVVDEKYYAHLIFPNGKTKNFPLPEPGSVGLVIKVENVTKGKLLNIQIAKSKIRKELSVIGVMGNEIVFNQPFNINDIYNCIIPVKDLPTGTMRLFVFDPQQNIIAETATFVSNENLYLPIKFLPDTLNKSANGLNVFRLTFPDSTLGTFSISVTDPDKEFGYFQDNIISSLLLNHQSQNKDITSITDTKKNFSDDNEKLEISVVTTKWPAINLQNLLNSENGSVITDTNFIAITGKVFRKNKLLTKGELNFIFQGKDSTFSFISTSINSNGGFVLKNLIYYDTARFEYHLNNEKDDIFIELDKPNKINSPGIYRSAISIDTTESFFLNSSFVENAKLTYKYLADTFGNIKRLKEVTIKAKKATPTQQVNDKYTRGVFQNSNMARIVDLINYPPNAGGQNILDYLQSRLPGLAITRNGSVYSLVSQRQLSISYSPQIKIFLNEQEVTQDFVTMIPLNDIALVKYYSPGNSLPGIGISGALAIYTKKQSDLALPTVSNTFKSFVYCGYSPVKDFENEIASRATEYHGSALYWNPDILVNEEKKTYSVKFKNPVHAKHFRVIIEGFSADGKLLYFETIL